MYIFGFEVIQYSSGTSWTLSVVLIFMSTTAQLLGWSFVLFFSDTAALLCSSLVSATVSLSMVSTNTVLSSVLLLHVVLQSLLLI